MNSLRHLAAMAVSIFTVVLPVAAADRPNVLFILADDMGWSDLRCYGHPYAQTPNLDKLATEGTRFAQFYSTGVTCCPARTGLMTSKFPASYAKYPAVGGFGDKVTITELLKKQGYATGHFGKWHIGPETKDGTYGIDTIGNDDDEDENGVKRKRAQTDGCRDAHIYNEAIRFIEKHKDGPFYVNVWDHIPHHPVNPSQALRDAFGPLTVDESKFSPAMREKFAACKAQGGDVNEHLRAWLSEIKAMDAEIGRLLQRLDELGLRDKTIVVFSSDQGPAPILSPEENTKRARKVANNGNNTMEIRLNAMGFAGPVRGSKHNPCEGGVRVPFIIRWPGHVPANRFDENSVISGIDWLPTLCTIAGVKIDAAALDGEDVSASWLGKAEHVRTKPLLWKTSTPNSDPTIRDGQWKLHGSHRPRGDVELYDILADRAESKNVAEQHPDVVKRLTAKLAEWQATLPKTYDKVADGDK